MHEYYLSGTKKSSEANWLEDGMGKITKLNLINIKKFRALSDISIPIANRITVICGKNGTSKSSILGLAAQGFGFRTDPKTGDDLDFSPILNSSFESKPSEHFRISKTHDTTGTMEVEICWQDGYIEEDSSLTLKFYNYKDRPYPRIVARKNSSVPKGKNDSIKATHPAIHLSLKRLLPIAERSKYEITEDNYFDDHKSDFIKLSKEILQNTSITQATATSGTISSASPHGKNYDHQAVSVGEDNVGQLALALMSFRKLKSEYKDYRGGLLLIDEADAGLFPAAQIALINTLTKQCKELDLQVILTTHSPLIIEEVHNLSLRGGANERDYKTIYLTDSYGKLEHRENMSWPQIFADLMISTIPVDNEVSLPKINVYCEDQEAFDFFNSIIREQNVNRCLNKIKDVTMGGDFFITLAEKGVPEFSQKGLVVLDGDKSGEKKIRKFQGIITLPLDIPPDQIIFEMLFNLPPEHEFWKNKSGFTKAVFKRISLKIIDALNIQGDDTIAIKEIINEAALEKGKTRQLFKEFYNDENLQRLIKGPKKENPFTLWNKINEEEASKFTQKTKDAIHQIYLKSYGINSAKISFLKK
jgi:predicted ATPase